MGQELDPTEVKRLMDKYIRADEARKAASKPHPKPVVQPRPVPAVDYDHEAWKSAEKCGAAACFRAYLKKYPQGQYAEMAQARLESAALLVVASPPPLTRQAFEPEMLAMTGSCFQIGSPANEPYRSNNENQHQVCSNSRSLYLG